MNTEEKEKNNKKINVFITHKQEDEKVAKLFSVQ